MKKDEMRLLKTKLDGGRGLQVQVEAGPPFFGVWNLLRNAAASNNGWYDVSGETTLHTPSIEMTLLPFSSTRSSGGGSAFTH